MINLNLSIDVELYWREENDSHALVGCGTNPRLPFIQFGSFADIIKDGKKCKLSLLFHPKEFEYYSLEAAKMVAEKKTVAMIKKAGCRARFKGLRK